MAFTTKKTMLDKIKDRDGVAWEEFYQMYKPLICIRAKQDRNLNDAEIDDLIQVVNLEIFKGLDSFTYDRSKGRFRDYLKQIIDRACFKIYRKRASQKKNMDLLTSQSEALRSGEDANCRWDAEWAKMIFEEALQAVQAQVTEKSFNIYKMLVIDEVDAKECARQLGVPTEVVYTAKHRVEKRLKLIVRNLSEL